VFRSGGCIMGTWSKNATKSGVSWRAMTAVGIAALTAALWTAVPSTGETATMTVKCAIATLNDVHHEWCKRYMDRLEKASNGVMIGRTFPAGQLGSIPRMIEGVQLGTIEALSLPPEFFVGLDPRFQALTVPFLFDSMDHAFKVLNDKVFVDKFLAMGEGKGIKGVTMLLVTPSSFVSRTPIRTPDDLKGKKIRVLATPIEIAMIGALGATGVPMPWGDVLPALQQGAVDGVQAGLTVFAPFKYYDVAKYHTNTNHYIVTAMPTISKKWWDGLPADLQRIALEEARADNATLLEWTKNLYDEGVKIWKERTKDGFIELTAEQRAAFRARMEGVEEKVAPQVPGLKELLVLLRAKSKQYAQ